MLVCNEKDLVELILETLTPIIRYVATSIESKCVWKWEEPWCYWTWRVSTKVYTMLWIRWNYICLMFAFLFLFLWLFKKKLTFAPEGINPFVPNAPFLYPLKTSENRKVEKRCTGSKWVYSYQKNVRNFVKGSINLL